jgi:hypothetical protein
MRTAGAALVVLTVFYPLTFCGCSHIKIVAFDKRQNTVTVQGGKWASDDDYQTAAAAYCQGPATLLAMHETSAGTYNTATAQSYGTMVSASGSSVPIRRYKKTFSCDSK